MFYLIVEKRLKEQYEFNNVTCFHENSKELFFNTENGIVTVKKSTSEVLTGDGHLLGYLRQ